MNLHRQNNRCFPSEILQQIFSYLSPLDLHKAAAVSTQWRTIAQDKSLKRVVILSGLTFLPFSFLRSVMQHASLLRVLDLSGSPITDHMASQLAQKPLSPLKRLHTLNVSKCILLSSSGFFHLFTAFSSATQSLTSLNIAECRVDDSVILQFVSKFVNLTFLDISRIWTLSAKALLSITTRCTKLQSVRMVNLTFIFDSAIASLAENCKDLSHVDVSCCYGLTTKTLAYLAEHPLRFLSIRGIAVNCEFSLPSTLKHLDMSKCSNITDAHLEPIFNGCSAIETLNLSDCPEVTAASLALLSKFQNSMKHLNISGCLALSPSGVELLLSSLPNVVELQIAHLNLADNTLHQLSRNLKLLDISHNTKITDNGILTIANTSPKIQVLICENLKTMGSPTSPSFGKCGITVKSLAHLRKSCSHLRELSFSGTLGWDIHSTDLIALLKACTYLEHICLGDGLPPAHFVFASLMQKARMINPNVKLTMK